VPAGGRHQPPHESAHLHVAGRRPYVDDLPELPAPCMRARPSPVAHGRLVGPDSSLRGLAGCRRVLTADDIPGVNDCGPVVHDDPILAAGEVRYVGQPVFAVIAESREGRAACRGRGRQVHRHRAAAGDLHAAAAHAAGAYVLPPMHLRRGDAGARSRRRRTAAAAASRSAARSSSISKARSPTRSRRRTTACCSLLDAASERDAAPRGQCLGLQSHHVQVQCRRMGGGFGGKESQSALFACVAAVAARRLADAVKLRVDRDDDFIVTGRRHCFHYEYEVGYDDDGRVLGAELTKVSRPASRPTSPGRDDARRLPLRQRLLAARGRHPRLLGQDEHAEQHRLPRLRAGRRGRSRSRTSSTASPAASARTRSTSAAQLLRHRRAEHDAVRAARPRQRHPWLVDELEATSGYRRPPQGDRRLQRAERDPQARLALTPLKFGISFNLVHLNQAGALVHVYGDGSVLVNHGGTEMGQGLNTKVAQVVAHELGVAFDAVRVSATDTQKIANTSATAASTGSDLNGKAAQDAARTVRERLAAFAAEQYGGAAAEVRFADGTVEVGPLLPTAEAPQRVRRTMPFRELVAAAYMARVQLWSDGFYATPGLHWNKETLQGEPFFYFAYGAAVSEVVVDTLTGEWKLLAADCCTTPAGRSTRPSTSARSKAASSRAWAG
jgi:xanthine dehydrogenase large subunit